MFISTKFRPISTTPRPIYFRFGHPNPDESLFRLFENDQWILIIPIPLYEYQAQSIHTLYNGDTLTPESEDDF